jgi:UDP-N-acetylmuramoyl-L-alanyl-D-glutamate--2,6-diaminopimelate ligase
MTTQLSTETAGIPVRRILPTSKLIGTKQISVSSCCGHWQDVQPGDVYVAVIGPEIDGHEFAYEAIEKGAVAVVTERLLAIDKPQILVQDTRRCYGEICHALAGSPSQRLKTIGVSGTDGKTVTAHLIQSILRADRAQVGMISSIEITAGKQGHSLPNKRINPPAIAEQLSSMVIGDCNHAVVEIPSMALADRSLSGVQLDIAVLTNIRRDPDNCHGNSKNYARAFLRMLDHLSPGGLAVVNADDPKSHFLLEKIVQPTLTVGVKQQANVMGKVLQRSNCDQVFTITAGSESVVIRTSMIGDQHVYNCLAAAAAGLALNISLQTIAQGIESAGQIPGRMQRVECGQSFGVWIDAATSATQLANALRTLRQVVTGKIWCVCSVEEGQSKLQRRMMGEVVQRAAGKAVITRTSADPMVDYEPIHQVLDGFEKPELAQVIPNRFKAIEWVLSRAQPGDAVLISGCGERPFALVGENKWTIADSDVCEAWLYDHSSMLEEEAQPEDKMIYDIEDFR